MPLKEVVAVFALFLAAPTLAVVCDDGFIPNTNGVDCDACSPGTYATNVITAATECTDCAVGKYSAWGSSACEECAQGRFAPKIGSATCKYCDAGKYSDFEGQTGPCVEACKAGWYAPFGSSQCYQCPKRSFQPEEGAGECMYCKTSAALGATVCYDNTIYFNRWTLTAFVVIGAVGLALFFRRLCLRYDSVFYGESCGLLKPLTPKQQATEDSADQSNKVDVSKVYESSQQPPAPASAAENPVNSTRV